MAFLEKNQQMLSQMTAGHSAGFNKANFDSQVETLCANDPVWKIKSPITGDYHRVHVISAANKVRAQGQ
jgi:hypothetical protein